MTTIALTSELEAVNTLLASIGESAVNSLSVTGLADLSAARRTLDEFSREVQLVGWHFNTEEDYPLPRDSKSHIYAPTNALKIILLDDSGIVQRGLKLYNKTKHTDTFDKDLRATVVFLLPWDELPQVARHYIMVRASRVFQTRTLGSDTQFQFSAEEEMSALKALTEAEGETGNYNMFSSMSYRSIMDR